MRQSTPPNVPLRVAIAATGERQKDVARRARITPWRLSRIVWQDATATPAERARLSRILKKPVEELFVAEATP